MLLDSWQTTVAIAFLVIAFVVPVWYIVRNENIDRPKKALAIFLVFIAPFIGAVIAAFILERNKRTV